MNTVFLVAVSILSIIIIVLSVYYGTKQCCSGMSGRRFLEKFIPRNTYAPPGSDEWEAMQWQQDWLPSDIPERGGQYEEDVGIQPAGVNIKDNPWSLYNYPIHI